MLVEKIKNISLKSLMWKFAGLVALAFLVMSAILLFSLGGFLNHKLEALYGEPEIKCQFMADLLANDLNPIIESDIDSLELESRVKAYLPVYGVYGLRYLFILDESNTPIVDTLKGALTQEWIDYNSVKEDKLSIRPSKSKDGTKKYYDCALPFTLAEKSQGTLRIGLWEKPSSLPVRQALKEQHSKDVTTPLFVMALLMTIVITVLLTLAFWWLVIRRIDSIGQATERMSFGDLDSDIEAQSQDEFGALEETLNQMRGNLKDAIERLKRRK